MRASTIRPSTSTSHTSGWSASSCAAEPRVDRRVELDQVAEPLAFAAIVLFGTRPAAQRSPDWCGVGPDRIGVDLPHPETTSVTHTRPSPRLIGDGRCVPASQKATTENGATSIVADLPHRIRQFDDSLTRGRSVAGTWCIFYLWSSRDLRRKSGSTVIIGPGSDGSPPVSAGSTLTRSIGHPSRATPSEWHRACACRPLGAAGSAGTGEMRVHSPTVAAVAPVYPRSEARRARSSPAKRCRSVPARRLYWAGSTYAS